MKREVPQQQAHRLLAARPVLLVTTMVNGQVNVMPLAWHCPVSLDPPLVALAIHPGTFTHDQLRLHEECVLNIPGRPLLETAVACGEVSGRNQDKIARFNLALQDGRAVDVPWIDDCLAHLEGVIVDRLQPGDHIVYIMQIVEAWAEEEAFAHTWIVPAAAEELAPLHHLGGVAFAALKPLPGSPDEEA